MTIFPSKLGGGIAKTLDDNSFLLRRALLSMPAHDYGYWHHGWSFCQDSEEWRNVLAGLANGANFASISQLIETLAKNVSEVKESYIHDFLKKEVDEQSAQYSKLIQEEEMSVAYWMHFVCHPGIWAYMKTKVISWGNDYDIFLKAQNGNNSNKMELRTYALYLDFIDTSIHTDMIKAREGWNLWLWQRENTCFCFDIDYKTKEFPDVAKIQIDVYHNRTKEDDYAYNLFVKTNDNNRGDAKLNKDIFSAQSFSSVMYGLEHSEKAFSRVAIIKELLKLLPEIRDIVNAQKD